MVAAYHYLGTPIPRFWGKAELRDFAPLPREISRYGRLGVKFFIIISGFVISMSSWGRIPAHFTVSRTTRRFPAHWDLIWSPESAGHSGWRARSDAS